MTHSLPSNDEDGTAGFDDYLGFDQILKIKRISNPNQIQMKI
jgi:hypothetical protein